MTAERKPVNATRDIFLMPFLIGIISTAGLASALLGDGVWDTVSWITLGLPVAVAAFFILKWQQGQVAHPLEESRPRRHGRFEEAACDNNAAPRSGEVIARNKHPADRHHGPRPPFDSGGICP